MDWKGKIRSEDRPSGQILEESLDRRKFVFLGDKVAEPKADVNHILLAFDQLYDLYKYCMQPTAGALIPTPDGSTRRVSAQTHTIASRLAKEIDVDLRHNLLQDLLVAILKAEFPDCPVHLEWKVAEGGRVDLVVDTGDGLLFCEIKVAPCVRLAWRNAIGQLLEYAHWPDGRRAKKWWVLCEEAPSPGDASYLQSLRALYGLPAFYRQIDVLAGVLGPET